MILGLIILFLSLALIFLLYRHQKLLISHAALQERNKNQQELEETFRHLSLEALDRSNRSFFEFAKEDLTKKHAQISDMVGKLESGILRIENERKNEQGALRQQLVGLAQTEELLRKETGNLVKALKSPTSRGRWGEIQLKRVVELSGMLSHCDFYEQVHEIGAEGSYRPDLIIALPGGRQVVVDAKVPLDAYLEAIQAQDEGTQLRKMKDHARQIRSHVALLAKKSYWEHFQPTPEFVVLFLPSDTVFSAALEQDPSLIEVGASQGVILATPTTLIAVLRAVSYGWKQESLSKHAEKVSELGHELYKRIVDMMQHWSKVGRSLGGAVEAYNKATGSLEARVLVTARKFQEMGAAASSLELEESEIIDRLPREFSIKKEL